MSIEQYEERSLALHHILYLYKHKTKLHAICANSTNKSLIYFKSIYRLHFQFAKTYNHKKAYT